MDIAKATIPYLYKTVTFYVEEILDLDDLTQKIKLYCKAIDRKSVV